MNQNLPENSQTPSVGPVGDNSVTLDSKFPSAVPISAPGNSFGPCGHAPASVDALICPTRADLNAHWPEGIRGFKPREAWQSLCQQLASQPTQPAFN